MKRASSSPPSGSVWCAPGGWTGGRTLRSGELFTAYGSCRKISTLSMSSFGRNWQLVSGCTPFFLMFLQRVRSVALWRICTIGFKPAVGCIYRFRFWIACFLRSTQIQAERLRGGCALITPFSP